MTRSATTVHAELASRRRGLQLFLARVETATVHGYLTESDARRAYAASFIELYSKVENSIETLLIGALMGRIAFSSVSVKPLVSIRSEAVARRVVFGSRSYADWIPFDYTRRRARTFLSRGRPFSLVPTADRKFLDGLGTIRNAIAHESGHALRRFEQDYIEGLALPPIQRRPSGYLRGKYSVGVSRFDYLSAGALRVIRDLCNN